MKAPEQTIDYGKCVTHGTQGPKKHLNYSPAGDHILLVCGCEYCICGQQCCPLTGNRKNLCRSEKNLGTFFVFVASK